ncbi:MAG: biotin/lipoyl-binding protein [Breznakibacter sp.]
MKTATSRIVIAAIVVVAAGLMVFQLISNKKEILKNIEFAQRKIEKVPVSVEMAQKGRLSQKVVSTGVLEASEVLNLVSETQGKIVKIYKRKGDRVNAGDAIVKVDDEVISANVLTAEANYAQFQRDVERFRKAVPGKRHCQTRSGAGPHRTKESQGRFDKCAKGPQQHIYKSTYFGDH